MTAPSNELWGATTPIPPARWALAQVQVQVQVQASLGQAVSFAVTAVDGAV